MKTIDLRDLYEVNKLANNISYLKSKDSVTFKRNSIVFEYAENKQVIYSINKLFTNKSWQVFVGKIYENLNKLSFNKSIDIKFNAFEVDYDKFQELKVIFKFMKSFHFKNVGINHKSMTIITDYLSSRTCRIKTLHLENNLLSIDAYEVLISGIQANKSLLSLILDYTHDFKNYYYDKTYKMLSKALCNSNIKGISLVEKSTPTMCMEYFAKHLPDNRALNKVAFGWSVYSNDHKGKVINMFAESIAKQGKIFKLENVEMIKFSRNADYANKNAIIKLNKSIKNNKLSANKSSKPQYSNMLKSNSVFFKRKEYRDKIQIPHEFFCSITHSLFINPVVASDNETYEFKAIKDWMSINCTSPITRESLSNTLLPNRNLKKLISDFIYKHKVTLLQQISTSESVREYLDCMEQQSSRAVYRS